MAASIADPPSARPPQIEAVAVRAWGQWVAAAVVLLVVAALGISLARNDNIDWSTVGHYLTAHAILSGVLVTLEMTVLSMAIGIALGVALAVMRMSANPVLRASSGAYVWFFRGTPLLVQIILWFNVALLFPHLGVGAFSVETNTLITPFVAALLGLGLNEGAYMAEIVRGGIVAVDRGQSEAAAALGMPQGMAMRRVILPQAMRVIIPPTGNEVINMLKTTALVSVVAASELLTNVQEIYSRTLQVIELLIVACVWYLALTTILSFLQARLERRFARGAASAARPG